MYKFVRILNSKKGSSLLVVIVVFAVVMILGTALLSVVKYSHDNAIENHRQQQAYYTARSAMDTILATLGDTATCSALSAKLQNPANAGGITTIDSAPNMGSYTTDLKYDPVAKRVKVVVKSKFQGVEYRIAATLKPGRGTQIDPTTFTTFSSHGGFAITPTGTIKGVKLLGSDVMTRGSQNLEDVYIEHDFINIGSVDAKGCTFGGKVIVENASGGRIEMTSGTTIARNLYTNTLSTDATIDAGTFVNPLRYPPTYAIPARELGMGPGVQPDIKEVRQNFISLGTPYSYLYDGTVIYSGNREITFEDGYQISLWDQYGETRAAWTDKTAVTAPPWVARTAADSTIERTSAYVIDYFNKKVTLLHDTTNTDDDVVIEFGTSTATVKIPSSNVGADLVANRITVGGNDYSPNDVITRPDGTCTISPSSTNFTGTISADSKTSPLASSVTSDLTVDTTHGDVSILVTENVTFTNANLNIIGNNNVYMYMADGKTFTATGSSEIGKNLNSGTQLYIIGKAAKMNLDGRSTFKGVAYLYGTSSKYSESSGATNSGDIKVVGSITAEGITYSGGNTYKYEEYHKKPFFNTTYRLDNYFKYPKLNANEIDWKLDYYGD